jgi:prenylcysteine oxidase / farnesylcysteine lyase
VTGVLNPVYFNQEAGTLLPRTILTTAQNPLFNSIGVRHIFNDEKGTTITKIFSSEKLKLSLLGDMYSWIDRIDRFEWDSYPVLEPWAEGDEGLSFKLDDGVFHVNAFEAAFSTMESEIVSARNVVELLKRNWEGKVSVENEVVNDEEWNEL